MTTRFASGFGVAAAIWIVSALLEPPGRYWLWGLALLVDFLTPWWAEGHGLIAPPDATHFPERFGLFTIILLGEFVAEAMHGIEAQEYWSLPAATTAFTGIAFAFVVWWYFDSAKSAAERHVRSRKQAFLFHLWNYSHLPLFLGLGVAGIGFEHLIALQSGEHLHQREMWILVYAVGVLMMALITIGATSESAQKRRNLTKFLWPQYAIAGIVISGSPFAHHLQKVPLALLLLMLCTFQAVMTQREMWMPTLASRKAS